MVSLINDFEALLSLEERLTMTTIMLQSYTNLWMSSTDGTRILCVIQFNKQQCSILSRSLKDLSRL